jgi:hypothetical protein
MAILKLAETEVLLIGRQEPVTVQPLPPCMLHVAETEPLKPVLQGVVQLLPNVTFCRRCSSAQQAQQ